MLAPSPDSDDNNNNERAGKNSALDLWALYKPSIPKCANGRHQTLIGCIVKCFYRLLFTVTEVNIIDYLVLLIV